MPPQERRAAILAAVTPLITDLGDAVTTRELAGAAGVSEGTIFNVFADKDELLSAVLEAALDQEPFEQAIRQIAPDAPLQAQLIEATMLIQHRIVDVWRLISSLGARFERPERPLPLSPALAEVFAAHSHQIALRPPEAAQLLRALVLSLTHPMLATEPMTADRIVEIFLHGIERPS
jgi:AcrR family transcriptional regulator